MDGIKRHPLICGVAIHGTCSNWASACTFPEGPVCSAADANSPAGHSPRPSTDVVRKGEAVEEDVLSLFNVMRLRLVRYGVRFGISLADGEDIVQETFLALSHHLKRGPSHNNLSGWLFRVNHNLALKKRAKMRREVGGLTLSIP